MCSCVLALDCSTALGSVALGWRAMDEPPTDYWRTTFPAGRGHGGALFAALRVALDCVRDTGDPLVEITVGLGPGSYSGVRQAIAAATGLAVATGARLLGVPSAASLDVDGPRFQAVGDARRGAFYYTAVEDGVCVAGPELLEDQASLQARLAERLDWPVFAVESVPEGLASAVPVALPSAIHFLTLPLAARVSPPLEPIYLRPVAFTLPKR